jgi:hypothetical protein
MFCPSCGTVLPGTAKFCLNCGRAVTSSTGSPTAPAAGTAAPAPATAVPQEAPPSAPVPELHVTLGEVPYAPLLTNIWLFAMVNMPVAGLQAWVRPTDPRGLYGEWRQIAVGPLRPGVLEQVLNLGDAVRWQYDYCDVRVAVRTADGRELHAAAMLPMSGRLPLRLALAPAQPLKP